MLETQRKKIDELDQQITALLEQRFDCAREVAEVKMKHGLPVLDSAREGLLLEKIECLCENPAYLPYVLNIYQTILTQSKDYQQNVIKNSEANG